MGRPLDLLVYVFAFWLAPALGAVWTWRRATWPSPAAARAASVVVWAAAPVGLAAGLAFGRGAGTGYWYPVVYLLGALAGGLAWRAWGTRRREGRDHTVGVAASLALAFVVFPAGIASLALGLFELDGSLLASHEVMAATLAAYFLAMFLLGGPARPREMPLWRHDSVDPAE